MPMLTPTLYESDSIIARIHCSMSCQRQVYMAVHQIMMLHVDDIIIGHIIVQHAAGNIFPP